MVAIDDESMLFARGRDLTLIRLIRHCRAVNLNRVPALPACNMRARF